MKGKNRVLNFEKYFDFFKMDKKNVQNQKSKIFYAKSVVCDDKNFLWSPTENIFFNFVTIKFCIKNGTPFWASMFWQYFGNVFNRKIATPYDYLYKAIICKHIS